MKVRMDVEDTSGLLAWRPRWKEEDQAVTGGKEIERPGRYVMSQGAGGTRGKSDPESTAQGSQCELGVHTWKSAGKASELTTLTKRNYGDKIVEKNRVLRCQGTSIKETAQNSQRSMETARRAYYHVI